MKTTYTVRAKRSLDGFWTIEVPGVQGAAGQAQLKDEILPAARGAVATALEVAEDAFDLALAEPEFETFDEQQVRRLKDNPRAQEVQEHMDFLFRDIRQLSGETERELSGIKDRAALTSAAEDGGLRLSLRERDQAYVDELVRDALRRMGFESKD